VAVEKQVKDLVKKHGRVFRNDCESELNDEDWKLFDKLRCAEEICYQFCFATTHERLEQMEKKGRLIIG
jgi:hypothetical protein